MPRPATRGWNVLLLSSAICALNCAVAFSQQFQPYGAQAGPYADAPSGRDFRSAASPDARSYQGNFGVPDTQQPNRGARLQPPVFGPQGSSSDPRNVSRGRQAVAPPYERMTRRPDLTERRQSPAQRQIPERKFFEPAQIIARVGDQPVYYCEMSGTVNQILAPHKDKATEPQLEAAREKLIKQMLAVTIDNKLQYIDFLRSFPEPDQLPEIMSRVDKQFYEKYLPNMIEKSKVSNAAELDATMRKLGSSLELSRLRFREQVLSQQVIQQKIDTDPEITHADMLDYYHEHTDDYAIPAKARWEQLMVRFDKFATKEEAWRAIGALGNRVYLGGAPLYAVAKENSQGFNSDKGGYHDWTNKGSLASDKLDQAVFSMPVGRLSRIIESKIGLHIVRVIERRDGDHIPFTEAQVEIKKKLRDEKVEKATKEYIASLRSDIEVWTIFDEKESTASTENDTSSGGEFRPAGSF
jgi:hypothetical protein